MILPLIEKNMGIAYLAKHDIDKAVFHLKRAIDMAPGMIESRYWLGISYLEKGNREKAVEEFQLVVELNPDSETAKKAKEIIQQITEK